jgi:hypothetical protein
MQPFWPLEQRTMPKYTEKKSIWEMIQWWFKLNYELPVFAVHYVQKCSSLAVPDYSLDVLYPVPLVYGLFRGRMLGFLSSQNHLGCLSTSAFHEALLALKLPSFLPF